MQWLDDAPEDWESAPEDPPAATGTLGTETLENGITIHDENSDGAYIYTDEDLTLEEYA